MASSFTDLDELRIVSWGFILRVTSSATNSQGLLTLNEIDDSYALNIIGSTWTAGTMQGPATRVFPIVAGAEYYFTSRPLGT